MLCDISKNWKKSFEIWESSVTKQKRFGFETRDLGSNSSPVTLKCGLGQVNYLSELSTLLRGATPTTF